MMRDPYTVLGVDRAADTETIRKSYKKLAKRFHPDVNKDPGAEERFKEVNAAYEHVGDPEKRKLWDEFGEAGTRPGFDPARARAWKAGGGRGPAGGDFGSVDVEDLLGSLFGGGGASGGFDRGPRRGADQQLELPVDFLSTVLGMERSVALRRPDGTTETLKVPIPAGARDGGKVRLKGQGLPPRGGGPCGDLIVILRVPDHPVLRRDGDDLELDLPVTVLEAMKGAAVTVPTPTGDVRVTVPAGVASGARLRIRGRGIQKPGRPGDLILVIRPAVPRTDDPAALAAAEQLERAYAGDVRAALRL